MGYMFRLLSSHFQTLKDYRYKFYVILTVHRR